MWPVQTARAQVPTEARPFEHIVIGATGKMALMRTVSPKIFVSFKQWLAAQPDRNAKKKGTGPDASPNGSDADGRWIAARPIVDTVCAQRESESAASLVQIVWPACVLTSLHRRPDHLPVHWGTLRAARYGIRLESGPAAHAATLSRWASMSICTSAYWRITPPASSRSTNPSAASTSVPGHLRGHA